MKATKAANKAKALEKLGLNTERKKIRRTRKMTEEQKQAARDRLAKARANRGPSQNKLIAESVRNLPEDNPLSLKNVRSWIKENKELLINFQRMMVLIINYKTISNKYDDDAFERTINNPPRGLGEKTNHEKREYTKKNKRSLGRSKINNFSLP